MLNESSYRQHLVPFTTAKNKEKVIFIAGDLLTPTFLLNPVPAFLSDFLKNFPNEFLHLQHSYSVGAIISE